MEEISWTDGVRKEGVLHRAKEEEEEENNLQAIKKGTKLDWSRLV